MLEDSENFLDAIRSFLAIEGALWSQYCSVEYSALLIYGMGSRFLGRFSGTSEWEFNKMEFQAKSGVLQIFLLCLGHGMAVSLQIRAKDW